MISMEMWKDQLADTYHKKKEAKLSYWETQCKNAGKKPAKINGEMERILEKLQEIGQEIS